MPTKKNKTMADFSKEYCLEKKMGFDGDFSIKEEFDKLEKDCYISMICEGYGFFAIAKNQDDECLLAYDSEDGVIWTEFIFN